MSQPRSIRCDLDVPIGPEWHNVELLRSAILNRLAAVFQNDELGTGVGSERGPEDDSGSGLGLVRVLYEGKCELEATLDDNVLAMHALSRSL